MFIDEAKIYIKAGKGGNGSSSFRREKYIPAGGPDGGDGGHGGSVIFIADSNIRTLIDFKYKTKYIAMDGEKGSDNKKSGKTGDNTVIRVPIGTIIRDDATRKILFDLDEDKKEFVACKGGRGGRGNVHFATPTRQAPTFSEAGEEGEETTVFLELKLLADVGIIGMPSVGKSSLISVISAARPKIADYHFTTLIPNLGVVKVADNYEYIVADIPGLIEGASDGAGLGHEFLKHVERTKLLIHLLDGSEKEGRDAIDDFHIINSELRKYDEKLSKRHQIVVLNKIDLCNDEAKQDRLKEIEDEIKREGYEVTRISAASTDGTKELTQRCAALLKELPDTVIFDEFEEYTDYTVKNEELFTVRKDGNTFFVEGKWITRLVNSTNTTDTNSLQYFQRLIREKGVIDELEKSGIQENDLVVMDDFQFEYIR
jgi:GTP-binding protein